MSKQISMTTGTKTGVDAIYSTMAGGNGTPLVIKGQAGMTYQLKSSQADQLLMTRKGKNLEIRLNGKPASAPPDMIIEDYYGDPATPPNEITGIADDGSTYSYVPQTGNTAELGSSLADGTSAYYSLSTVPSSLAAATAVAATPFSISPVLLGALGIAGVTAAVAHRQFSNGTTAAVTDINDNLVGSDGNDLLDGGTGNDTIAGNNGDDTVIGGEGNDILNGGDGNDSLDGGNGNDVLNGGNGDDTLSSGDGNDSLDGGNGNDVLDGGNGDDILSGGEGNDTLIGGNGNDSLAGGNGNDLLSGGNGNDSLTGGDGNDTLIGGPGNDLLDGGNGDDSLIGNDGDDTLIGGNGNDTILGGTGNDSINAGDGDDMIVVAPGGITHVDGGNGDDTLDLTYLQGQVTIDTVAGGPTTVTASDGTQVIYENVENLWTNDMIIGTSGNDTLNGGAGNDTIVGNGGDDVIIGGDGDDSIIGSNGDDIIDAGSGNDIVFAGSGNDSISAGDGDDSVNAGDGNDTVDGGNGNDTLFGGNGDDSLAGGEGNDVLSGDNGSDTLLGGNGDDSLAGGGDNDVLSGDNGNDTLLGGNGNDSLAGGEGNDVLSGDNGSDTLLGGNGDDSLAGGEDNDVLSGDNGSDTLLGGNGDDSLAGGEGNDVLSGDNGSDTLLGGNGDDSLAGGEGNDVLSGGDGNDSIDAGDGNDSIDAGNDNDTVSSGNGDDVISGGNGNDIIDAGNGNDTLGGGNGDDSLAGGEGNDVLSGDNGNDTLLGGNGDDSLGGGDGNDTLQGGNGDDSLSGGNGNDVLSGGSGNDTLLGGNGDDSLVRGGDGNDNLSGGNGNDTLIGTPGDDTLDGGNGDDLIIGNGGNDSLIGGVGNDTIVAGGGNSNIDAGSGNDVISVTSGGSTFVDGGNGDDTIDLSGLQGPLAVETMAGGATTVTAIDGTVIIFQNVENTIGSINDLLIGDDNDNTLNGGAGNDTLIGNDGNDLLIGGQDNDSLMGNDGIDTLDGGDGNDFLDGGNSDDLIFMGAGDNTVYGGEGNDSISGDEGNNLVYAGNGDDNVVVLNGNNTIDGGDGNDIIQAGNGDNSITGGAGDDVITAGDGNNTLSGGDGNDFIQVGNGNDILDGGSGDDTLLAGDGDNTISAGNGNDFVQTNNGNDAIDAGNGDDTVLAGDGDNTITSGDGNDYIQSGNGNDVIDAGNDNDTIYAGNGDNTVSGGNGDNVVFTGTGNDSVDGGNGNDVLNVGDGNNTVDGGDGNNYIQSGNGNDVITTGNGDDSILAGDGDNVVSAGDGNDVIISGNGNDNLSGGNGDDFLIGGSDGNDTLDGGNGNDFLISGNGSDLLLGGDGNDTLIGGPGPDTLDGGNGDDYITGNNGSDSIIGGSGNDIIDTGADNDTVYAGDDNDYVIAGPGGNKFLDGGNGDDTLDLSHLSGRVTVSGDISTGATIIAPDGTEIFAINFEHVIFPGGDTIQGVAAYTDVNMAEVKAVREPNPVGYCVGEAGIYTQPIEVNLINGDPAPHYTYFWLPDNALTDIQVNIHNTSVIGLLNGSSFWLQAQKEDGSWATIADSSGFDIINLFGWGGNDMGGTIANLQGGQYRLATDIGQISLLGTWTDVFISPNVHPLIANNPVAGPAVTGNVTTDPSFVEQLPDDKGPNNAAVVWIKGDDGNFVAANGTVVHGLYGTLTINADGSYSYQPKADLGAIGHVDTFDYGLVHPNGTVAAATLNIRIDSPQAHLEWSPTDPYAPAIVTGSVIATDNSNHVVADVVNSTHVGGASDSDISYSWLIGALGVEVPNPFQNDHDGSLTINDDTKADIIVNFGQGALLAIANSTYVTITKDGFGFVGGGYVYNLVDVFGIAPGDSGFVLSNQGPGTYRIHVETDTGLGIAGGVSGTVNSVVTELKHFDTSGSSTVSGNVITDNDGYGTDLKPASATLTVKDDNGNWVVPNFDGVTLHGQYGTLHIYDNGSYTYKPNVNGIGQTDHFSYVLNAADGSVDGGILSVRADASHLPDISDAAENFNYVVNPTNNVLEGSSGTDMLDGKGANFDGQHDIAFNAGGGDDFMLVYDTHFVSLDGGSGTDTLIWQPGSNLNLADIAGKTQNIEVISLQDKAAQANTLTLSLDDLLAVTPNNNGAHTVHDAIALAVRLQNMYVHELQLDFNVRDGWANLELRKGYFLGKARPYFVEWLMFSMVQADTLFGIGAGPTEIWFDYAEPDYMEHYRGLTAVPIRYNMPHNLLRFPAAMLDKPIPTADPIARAHAIKVCEEEIRRHAEETDDILARVRALLVISNDNGYPDADTVASKLNVSGRTLSRKLKEYSTGFRELLEQSRQRDAALLLQDPLLEIRDIAERLGYENPANFTRAFFKWNGMPPTHWRARKIRNMQP
jgi:Ca2+-binding RTX toxin-like protein/AraC-like DNA-binding protein